MIIKLLGNKKNKDEGFYALMINGSLNCFKGEVFSWVDEKQLKALKKTKCPYKVLK